MKNYTIIQISNGRMFNLVKEFKTVEMARQYLRELAKSDKDSKYVMVDQNAKVYSFVSLKD